MIELHTMHFATIKSIKNFGLDYTKFDTVDELKAELQRLRVEKARERLRVNMRQKYIDNPEKYRQMRYINRAKEIERNPEKYKLQRKEYSKNSYLKKKIQKVEEFKVLELTKKIECDVCDDTKISYWSDDI